MALRIMLLGVVVVALLGLLIYSQSRTPAAKVSGFVEADEIRVGSRVGGRVKAVHVVEGQAVTAGDAMVELEPYDLREKLAQAEARLAQSTATLEKLRAGPRPQEIAEAQAEVQLAEARLELAQMTLNRIEPAVQRGAARAEELDQARQDFKVATATLAARKEALSILKEGSRKEDIAAAEAVVQENKASVGALRRQIDELVIKAPLAGTVEAVELRPGDLIAASAPALSIMDTSNLWVRAYVPENRLNLTVGTRVRVTIDSFPREQFAARISFVSRQAEFTPGNVQTPEERSKQVFRIKATLESGLDKLRPGMSADVWLDSAVSTPTTETSK